MKYNNFFLSTGASFQFPFIELGLQSGFELLYHNHPKWSVMLCALAKAVIVLPEPLLRVSGLPDIEPILEPVGDEYIYIV